MYELLSKRVACYDFRPFWVSPRQVLVLPVAAPFKEYAGQVAQRLWDAGLYAEADTSDSTLNKRIRNAELAQVRPFTDSTWRCALTNLSTPVELHSRCRRGRTQQQLSQRAQP